MTLQEIYTKVRRHLLTQNAKSLISGKCKYRGAGGMKCAIGCLIPDTKYTSGLEGWGVGNSAVRAAAGLDPSDKRYDPEQYGLVSRLQAIHDCCPVERWEPKLDEAAVEFGLKIEPDEAT